MRIENPLAGEAHASVPFPSEPHESAGRGIALMLLAVCLFSVMNALAKLAAERYALGEVAFFRSFFSLVPAGIMLARAGGVPRLRTARLRGHFWRSLFGLSSMVGLFWSYHLLPLADATALSFSAPLFLTVLSVPVLGEKVGVHRWSAVAVGFLGVLVIARPSGDMLNLGFVVAMVTAVATALAMIAIRQLGRTEPPVTTVFYFALFTTLLSALSLPFCWTTPSPADLGLLAAIGLFGGVAQHFQTRAYALAPATVIGPFNYAGIVWATLFGWMVWGNVPGVGVLVGAAIVIASGLYILYRETRRGVAVVVRAAEAADD